MRSGEDYWKGISGFSPGGTGEHVYLLMEGQGVIPSPHQVGSAGSAVQLLPQHPCVRGSYPELRAPSARPTASSSVTFPLLVPMRVCLVAACLT